MNEPSSGGSEAARERQSHVRHELRAPLAVMYPLLSLLTEEAAGPLTATQREYLEMLERNIGRLHVLIASAAESGWLDCAAVPQERAAVQLLDLAEEVASRAKAAARPARADIAAGGVTAAACADREQVRCVLRNLVDNAVTYAPEGCSVRIVVGGGRDGAAAEVAVRDDGPGMSAEDARQAFEFGFRGEAARETGTPGLGAGLWVCRELVGRNGGSIALHSVEGEGTTVTVTLPAPVG